MVQGAMVLLRGVRVITIYNRLGIIVNDGCSNSIVLNGKDEEFKIPVGFVEKSMLWHQRVSSTFVVSGPMVLVSQYTIFH